MKGVLRLLTAALLAALGIVGPGHVAARPFECHDKTVCNDYDTCSEHDALLRSGHLCHGFPYYNGYAPLRSTPWRVMVRVGWRWGWGPGT